MSHQYETIVAAEKTISHLTQLVNKYGANARQFIYDYGDGQSDDVYYQTPSKIVVHHSATDTCSFAGINNSHLKRTGGMNTSTVTIGDTLSDVSYHRIINSNGDVGTTRKDNEVGRGTDVNNTDSIHILFCGNFNVTSPTTEQYKAGAKIISELRAEYGDLPVYGHNQLEGEATACPGKNFDYRMLSFYIPTSTIEVPEQKEVQQVISTAHAGQATVSVAPAVSDEWKVTAYYNCVKGQDSYYQGSYEAEKKINGCGAFAAGRYGLDDHKYTHGACSRDHPLGTKLWIDGRSETYGEFTCVDRGSGIVGNHIDIRYGIGQEALDNIRGGLVHPTRTTVKVVKVGTGKR